MSSAGCSGRALVSRVFSRVVSGCDCMSVVGEKKIADKKYMYRNFQWSEG